MPEPARSPRRLLRWFALALGPLAYALLLRTASDALGPDQREVLGVGLWMLIWWLTEPVPLAATALLPIIVLPIHGVLSMKDVTAPYANEMILLFLAGFMIAAALERWGAHTRLALGIVERAGRSGRGIVLGFMTATALVSMFISNTATAAMMYPIALAVGQLFGDGHHADRLRTALLLGLAYAASIGGMGTLLGTPPNLILAGSARELLGVQLDFTHYLLIGVPCVLLLLPLCWALLVHVFFRSEVRLDDAASATIHERRQVLGPLRGGEAGVLAIFALTAIGWLMRQPKTIGALQLPGLETLMPGLTDASIGLAGALLLFVFQARDVDGETRSLLTWHDAKAVPWDVLLLFGGGLSIATAMETTGVTQWFGERLRGLEGMPPVAILLGVSLATVLLSELASNTAVAAMAMPVAAGLATAVNIPPLTLMAVASLSASAGFALPIATPPNAIAYGSGRVRSRDMLRAGLALDVVAALVVVAVVTLSGFGR